MSKIFHIIDWHNNYDRRLYDREIEAAAKNMKMVFYSPFFKALKAYVERGTFNLIVLDTKVDNISVSHQRDENFMTLWGKYFSI